MAPVLQNLFGGTVYVRVSRNAMRVRLIDSGEEVTVKPETPFTSPRLLIGEFLVAENTLKGAMRQLFKGRWFRPSPTVLIQPMELIEGGMSEVEKRILQEAAIGAGASRAIVWSGKELTDDEVRQKIAEKR